MAITIMVTPCRSLFMLILCSSLAYWVATLYLEDLREIHIRSSGEKSLETKNDKIVKRLNLGNLSSHLHWFVQISDLHLSVFDGSERADDLLTFCLEHLRIIKPEVVLITGDLTDAKLADKQGSRQFIEEWESYNRVLNESGIAERTVWLDIRGNHDAFDVPSLTSSKNYFRTYSVSGQNKTKSYQYIHRTPDGDSFSFIAVDAVPVPGPRRPFNFFGIIDKTELERIERYVSSAGNITQTIFFSHYPTSTINYPQHILRDILGRGIVYLCGHLHTLGGFVPRMYALQQTGYLELELGDWRDARLYRLLVVDHGLLSFVDIDMHTWPVILVTNPKNSQYYVNKHEDIDLIRDSTHIRILVFTKAVSVSLVIVSIDGVELGQAQHAEGPLYVLKWNPALYNSTHLLHVYVKDSDGREAVYDQSFSFHYTLARFGFWRRFILMSDHTSLLQMVFAIYFTATVFPLVIVKIFQVRLMMVAQSRVSSCVLRSAQTWLRRFNLIGTEPKIYYPLLFYNAYILVGPWFIGEVLEDHVGACFLFGIFVKGTWIPCSLTYFYGALQLIMFNLALSLYLGYCLDLTRCADKDHSREAACRPQNTILRWLYYHWFFILIITLQIYLVIAGFYKAYGVMALALCPMRTWAVCLAVYLRYQALNDYQRPSSQGASRADSCLVTDS